MTPLSWSLRGAQRRSNLDPTMQPDRNLLLIDELLLHECSTRCRIIQDADPPHEFEGRKCIGAEARCNALRRVVVPQNELCIAPIEPSFRKPIPAQIEVWVQKKPYQVCIERSECLPPIRRARGPVLVNDIDEIRRVSGLVDAMVEKSIGDGADDARVARNPAQDGGY